MTPGTRVVPSVLECGVAVRKQKVEKCGTSDSVPPENLQRVADDSTQLNTDIVRMY